MGKRSDSPRFLLTIFDAIDATPKVTMRRIPRKYAYSPDMQAVAIETRKKSG